MDVTVTTQLENLIVTIDNADTSSNTQTHTEDAAAAHTNSATLSLDNVGQTEDRDDLKDSDR